ncbi:protein of unknown function [Pararobbsia alpina]
MTRATLQTTGTACSPRPSNSHRSPLPRTEKSVQESAVQCSFLPTGVANGAKSNAVRYHLNVSRSGRPPPLLLPRIYRCISNRNVVSTKTRSPCSSLKAQD